MYLADCLDSVKAQSYKEFEVLCINDGSTDKSLQIIQSYLKDERFKLLNQSNKGVSAARNAGIIEARGDYICFVDADDVLAPKYLECLNSKAKESMD